MRIDVFTIFPDVVAGYCGASILGRAVDAGALDVRVHDLRQGADDPRRSVDDSPFGGGAGMVLMAEPLFRCVESVPDLPRPLYLLAPGGRRFDQEVAAELAALAAAPPAASPCCAAATRGWTSAWPTTWSTASSRWATSCWPAGSWRRWWWWRRWPACCPTCSATRTRRVEESFTGGLLEYPQYTRPAEFRGWAVPEVLRSGDHGAVAAWRRTQALLRTAERRPDLIERLVRASALSASDVQALGEHGYDVPSGTEPE